MAQKLEFLKKIWLLLEQDLKAKIAKRKEERGAQRPTRHLDLDFRWFPSSVLIDISVQTCVRKCIIKTADSAYL